MSFASYFRYLEKFLLKMLLYLVGLTVVYLCLPVLIILLLPIIIFRRIVFHSAHFLRPDLGKMVNTKGSCVRLDDIYKCSKGKLVIGVILQGCPTKENIMSNIESVIATADPNTKDLLYPELKQNITQWMGYSFWKPVTNFKLDDHIFYLQDNLTGHQEAVNLMKQETLRPFHTDKALWKLIIIPNYIPEKSALYFDANSKFSFIIVCAEHMLADGFSLSKLVTKISQADSKIPALKTSASSSEESTFENVLYISKMLIKLPLDVGEFLVDRLSLGKIWSSKLEEAEEIPITEVLSRKMDFACGDGECDAYPLEMSPVMRFSDIRAISRAHKVSTFSVIISAVTGTIRNEVFGVSKNIPEKVNFVIPFPLPGHPDKLRNHVTLAPFTIPVGERDPLIRLHIINNHLKQIKNTSIPIFLHWMGFIFGSLPTPILEQFHKVGKQDHVVWMTSFPGPSEGISAFKDCLTRETFFMGSMVMGTKTLGFSFTTHAGFARLLVSADKSVLPDQAAKSLVNGFMQQVLILGQCVPVEGQTMEC